MIVDDGEGRVVSLNLTRRTATIILDSGKTLVSSWEELLPVEGEVIAKFPESEPAVEAVIEEYEQPIVEEPNPEPPPKTFNGAKNFNRNEKNSDDEHNKPWINRPRKPRRPRGKFR